MKKRVISMLLVASMALTMLPATAVAAETTSRNYSDVNVTWIGTQAEYQKTLDNMFVNGMRKMKAGDKWGIVDATGEWVAPPIYDKIELKYLVARSGVTNDPIVSNSEPLEVLFMDGYTQCVRGGKMGLLNQYGEEVIPAKYDSVGLPSEGICRIVKKTGGTHYLGYWSLELGRELVAPNKYVVSIKTAAAEGTPMVRQMLDTNSTTMGVDGSHDTTSGASSIDYQQVMLPNGNRLAAQHDYMDGYVFVTIGQAKDGLGYGTILDKTGKEILPGGPYPFRFGTYPQFGQYMIYVKQSNKSYSSDHGNLGKPYMSGVVGPEGVIIPAQYTGGVRSPIEGWYVGDARMTIIPELKLVITAKDTKPGKENGGKVGVVNFKNKTVIPFTHDFNYFSYNQEHKLFVGMLNEGSRIYTASGKRLNNKDYSEIGPYGSFQMVNGFAEIKVHTATTIKGVYDATITTGFVNLKTGANFFPDMLKDFSRSSSDFSVNGLVWLRNPEKKWGLVNGTGKVILPYQYDAVNSSNAWTRAQNGYAIVNIGRKQGIVTAAGVPIVPCEYEKLYARSSYGPVHEEYVEATKNGKTGLLSVITGKLVIPCIYDGIGGMSSAQYRTNYFTLGATVVKTGNNSYCLVNKNGVKIPGSDYQNIYVPKRGLFGTTKNGSIGVEGKVVFPDTLSYVGRKNFVIDDTTLVVRDGKVGYINASLLAKPTTPKSLNPDKATAAPSKMNLVVDGKSVVVESYTIGSNNYIKIRDMAYFVNGTAKNFGVVGNGTKSAIELKSKTSYSPVAGDMGKGDGTKKTAVRVASPVYVDGVQRILTAYAIGGSNFFNLQDVMRTFDIFVGFDNGTVTVDTTRGYALTAGAQGSVTPPATEAAPPPASQVNKLEIIKSPNLEFYMTGNHTFSATGFELRYWDGKGVPHTITNVNEMTFTVEGKVIRDGYVFTVSSMKEGTVGYNGITAPLRFPVYLGVAPVKIDTAPGQTNQTLANGKYTLSILGNTVGMSNGWMVLDSKTPVTFGVEKDGDSYYIFVDEVTQNNYIGVSFMNGQLIGGSKTKWSITHLGGSTYSIRLYNELDRVVNASGQQKKDGTPVIVYKHKNTPENAIVTFTPAR